MPPQTTNYIYAGGYDRLKKYTVSGTGSMMTLYLADYEVEGVGSTAGVLQISNLQRINIALMNGQSISLETNPATGLTSIIYHHTDHLTGSSVDTDSNGYMLEVQDYLPFGGSRVDQKFQSYANKKNFTGKELDPESGLYYYGARYYNADIGRWMGLDPLVRGEVKEKPLYQVIFNPQELNGYSYVLNNPMKLADNTGLYPVLSQVTGMQSNSDPVSLATNVENYISNNRLNAFQSTASLTNAAMGQLYRNNEMKGRYTYVTSFGWVDLKHFFSASEYASKWGYSTAEFLGVMQETKEKFTNSSSAYSFEDLTSNSLGAYFGAYYLPECEKKGYTYSEALQQYFKELGVVSADEAKSKYGTVPLGNYKNWQIPETLTVEDEANHPIDYGSRARAGAGFIEPAPLRLGISTAPDRINCKSWCSQKDIDRL